MIAPDRVAQVAADIVKNISNSALREAMAGGKGMIVAIGRRVAVDLYDRIAALGPEWVSADPRDDSSGMLKVVITGNGNADPAALRLILRSKKGREDLAERFKKPDSASIWPSRTRHVADGVRRPFAAYALHRQADAGAWPDAGNSARKPGVGRQAGGWLSTTSGSGRSCARLWRNTPTATAIR